MSDSANYKAMPTSDKNDVDVTDDRNSKKEESKKIDYETIRSDLATFNELLGHINKFSQITLDEMKLRVDIESKQKEMPPKKPDAKPAMAPSQLKPSEEQLFRSQLKRLREELYHEKVQRAQTELLIHRMLSSTVTTENSNNNAKEQEDARSNLVSQCNALEMQAVQMQQELDRMREERDDIFMECESLRRKIRLLQRNLSQKDLKASPPMTTEDANDSNLIISKLQDENKMLKGVLLTLVSQSGIDWFSDPTLRLLMKKLERVSADDF